MAEGSPCDAALEGMSCAYGDDCGGYSMRCQDGRWVVTGTSGCNAPIVPCREGPQVGDGCPHFSLEVCDPEDDCVDVLVCEQFNWISVDECPKTLCERAGPVVPGEPCRPGPLWLGCPGAAPCDEYVYTCSGEWSPVQPDPRAQCGLANPFVGEYEGTTTYTLGCNEGEMEPFGVIRVEDDGNASRLGVNDAVSPSFRGHVDDDGSFEATDYNSVSTCSYTGIFSGPFATDGTATGDFTCTHVPVVGDPFDCSGTWAVTEVEP